MPITHITTCMICPAEKPGKIVANEIPQIRPGEMPPAAVFEYMEALKTHLKKKHPEVFQQTLVIGQMLMDLLVVAKFQTSDPGVENARHLTRAFLHKLTRGNDADERDLQIRAERVNPLSSTVTAAIIVLELRDLRDYLLEEGEYEPKVPEPAAIVTP